MLISGKTEEEHEARNAKFVSEYREFLVGRGLEKKSIERRVGAVEDFLETNLYYALGCSMEESIREIPFFFGCRVPGKYAFSDKDRFSEMIRAVRDFYFLMGQKGRIGEEEIDMMEFTIKEEHKDWMQAFRNHRPMY